MSSHSVSLTEALEQHKYICMHEQKLNSLIYWQNDSTLSPQKKTYMANIERGVKVYVTVFVSQRWLLPITCLVDFLFLHHSLSVKFFCCLHK